jgi:hypothetical protein
MTVEAVFTTPSDALPEFVAVLQQAAQGFRAECLAATDVPIVKPPSQAVVQALLRAEQAAKKQRLEFPFAALLGEWQLCLSAPRRARLGAIAPGRYFPKFAPAQISFQLPSAALMAISGAATIGNQVQLGPLRLKFTGPARYLGKKNLLTFDFLNLRLDWGDRTFFQRDVRGGTAQAAEFYAEAAIGQHPFFAFFWVAEDFIAARGRGGGLALWVRPIHQPD